MVAIITGGTRGIGKAIARSLQKEGYNIVITGTGVNSPVDMDAFKPAKNGGSCMYIKADTSSAEDRQNLITTAFTQYGYVDLLVNNSGVAPLERKDILEMDEESYNRVMDINLKGMFFLTQLYAKWLIAEAGNRDWGTEDNLYSRRVKARIINISSMSAYTSSISRGEYCISKAGISMVTKLFADRLASEGINVYEIRPGVIKTDMTSAVESKYDALIKNGIFPIGRWGTPDDVAKAVLGIAGGYLDYSTGEILNIDGGFHIRRL